MSLALVLSTCPGGSRAGQVAISRFYGGQLRSSVTNRKTGVVDVALPEIDRTNVCRARHKLIWFQSKVGAGELPMKRLYARDGPSRSPERSRGGVRMRTSSAIDPQTWLN